ncbi:MAG: type I DNA topoisomerase [Deltaproteobacteria bacterium]|nr:type I DNA topoisomerase [Deltaproteobacteria bacterium]
MAEKALLIVESPAKAKTIKKYLGRNFVVKASVGHIMDLPKSKIGVAVDQGFKPEYVVINGKQKVLAELKKAAKDVDHVYLAPDPDREGEAIAWHIAQQIKKSNPNISRVLFNEITKKGVQQGLANPHDIDQKKFHSQQSRRILDRLVGYEISPVLWKKIRRGLSAGRVQSVAVRLIVEREREILAFRPEEYWQIEAEVAADRPPAFTARLWRHLGNKIEVATGDHAARIVGAIRAARLHVAEIEKKERRRSPPPPYTTSRLQQDASSRYSMTAKRTMQIAQQLYEGVDLGEEGSVGLITYMRTDSVRLSEDAVAEVRGYIEERWGAAALPPKPAVYKSKKSAQDAHEAIRPTSTAFPPQRVAQHLTNEQLRIYTMIWNRFVACQMAQAVYDATSVDIQAGEYTLRANGSVLKVPGWLAVYGAGGASTTGDEEDDVASGAGGLPDLAKGEALRLTGAGAKAEQKFTQPPPRFTEGMLVKEMEERGIGRPSTYASILSTIIGRDYVEKVEGKLVPTELGALVTDKLVRHFPKILDVEFTAQMEESLDLVEDGSVDWALLLATFYEPFHVTVEKALVEMDDVKTIETPTDNLCPKCGKPMVIKWGRHGSFLACTGYPACRTTAEIKRGLDGKIEIVPPREYHIDCETCGKPMALKRGRFGEFLACTGYPECKGTRPIPLDVPCPKCGGDLAARKSKKGKTFYGCLNFQKTGCDFLLWEMPVPNRCPECEATFLVKTGRGRGAGLKCATPGCGYTTREKEEGEPVAETTGESAAIA